MTPGGGASLVLQATGRDLTGPPTLEAEGWPAMPVTKQDTGMKSLKHHSPNIPATISLWCSQVSLRVSKNLLPSDICL